MFLRLEYSRYIHDARHFSHPIAEEKYEDVPEVHLEHGSADGLVGIECVEHFDQVVDNEIPFDTSLDIEQIYSNGMLYIQRIYVDDVIYSSLWK